MTITTYEINNVLRTYGKQLRRGVRLNKIRQDESQQADQINISPEAKRQTVVEQVAAEIIFRMAASDRKEGGVEQEILRAVSNEYGQPLNVTFDRATESFEFHVVDTEKGEVVKTLAPEESASLNHRMTELARQIVDRTLL